MLFVENWWNEGGANSSTVKVACTVCAMCLCACVEPSYISE